MTLEIKSERRNLTFGSGEPAVTHEEAINTLNAFLRADQIAEMAKTACASCDYDNNGSCDLLVTPGQCSRALCIAEAFYNAGYRKQVEGEWISHEGYEECGECHAKAMFQHNFCPNRGAKMKRGESDDR